MNCEYFKELISARLDSELTSEEETVLSGHISQCDECSRLSEELRVQRELHRAWKPPEIPADIEKKILDKTIRSSKRAARVISFLSGNYLIPKPVVWVTGVIIVLAAISLLRPVLRMPDSDADNLAQSRPEKIQKVIITDKDIVKTRTYSGKINL